MKCCELDCCNFKIQTRRNISFLVKENAKLKSELESINQEKLDAWKYAEDIKRAVAKGRG